VPFLKLLVPIILFIFILLLLMGRFIEAREKSKRTGYEFDSLNNQLKNTYPANRSERGYLCDIDNTLPINTIAYLVAEDDFIYIVTEEDMLPKLKIPFDNIIDFSQVKLKELYTENIKNIPDTDIMHSTIYKFEYQDLNTKKVFYFILGLDSLSFRFNYKTNPDQIVRYYIKTRMKKRINEENPTNEDLMIMSFKDINIRQASEADKKLFIDFAVKLSNYNRQNHSDQCKYDDYDAVIAAIKKHAGETFDNKNEDTLIFIAELDGIPTGYALGRIFEESATADNGTGRMGLIDELFLDETARGLGLGKKLLTEIIHHMKELGITRIKLHAYSWNQNAVKLYENMGFKEYAVSYEQFI